MVRLPPYVCPLGDEDEVKICPRGAARGDNDCWLDAPSIFDLIKYFGDDELSVTTYQHGRRVERAVRKIITMDDVESHQTSSTGKGGTQLLSRVLAIKLFRGYGVPDDVWQPFISHCTTAHAMDVDDEPAADEVMGRPPHRIQTISRRQKRPKPATPISSPLMLKSPDAKRLHRRSPIKGRNVTAAPVVTVAKDAGLRLLTDAGKTLEESSSAARRPVYLDDDVVDVAKRVRLIAATATSFIRPARWAGRSDASATAARNTSTYPRPIDTLSPAVKSTKPASDRSLARRKQLLRDELAARGS